MLFRSIRTLVNETAALNNPLGDILEAVLTLIIEGRLHLNKDMRTTLIRYDYPRHPSVELA